MDKSWIELVDRFSIAYMDGIEKFLEFAYANKHFDSVVLKSVSTVTNIHERL